MLEDFKVLVLGDLQGLYNGVLLGDGLLNNPFLPLHNRLDLYPIAYYPYSIYCTTICKFEHSVLLEASDGVKLGDGVSVVYEASFSLCLLNVVLTAAGR